MASEKVEQIENTEDHERGIPKTLKSAFWPFFFHDKKRHADFSAPFMNHRGTAGPVGLTRSDIPAVGWRDGDREAQNVWGVNSAPLYIRGLLTRKVERRYNARHET